MNRRKVLGWLATGAAAALMPTATRAGSRVPVAFDWTMAPPLDGRDNFVSWMQTNRGEDPSYLRQRWDRYQQLIAHHDLWDDRDKRAYLLTPREEFVTANNLSASMSGTISTSAMASPSPARTPSPG